MLGRRFYNIVFAENGKTAMNIILERKIDLIIFDEDFENLNSIDFLEQNKTDILIKQYIPVIILTNQTRSNIVRDGLELGAVDIIQKPFILEEIILKIKFWTGYKQKEKDIQESTKLLNQYKDTVDRSSIVAKTNSNGIITYVNDQFCSISGYSKDELIGASHNILRNNETPNQFYKKLWVTIKDKKQPWKNTIKNLNKKKESYWVKTIINPILDVNGKIIEYIAISQDITNEQKIKNYFKAQFNNSTENLNQAMNLYDEYKRAINESSIVSRTDLKGYITFVNEKFCVISGYKKEELLGENHNIIRHPDMKKEIFKEVWKTIKAGKTWQGIIKNKTKSGGIYWVDSTIVPIKDKRGKIIEYMGIRKDVTTLFNLHDEMDNTQKEIIYRMGEICETRSKETGNHVKRVAEYSKLLGELYGLDEKTVNIIFIASPMHDIGKVGIPDSILKKAGKLTDEEFRIMKSHSEIGFNILKGSKKEVLKAAAIVANEHHEKWNGKGYPRGLVKEEIHIFGRITAIADVFDALGSDRCYKKAWDDEKIFNFLKEEKGKSFDPLLINLFFKHIDKFIYIRNKYKN